jgi:predicted permease
MFRSLPVADPSRLYRLGDSDNCCVIGGMQGQRFSIYSYPLYLHLRDHLPEFQQLAAFQGGPARVGVHRGSLASPSEPFVDQFVSGNYFLMFGLRPFAGRLLTPADDARNAPPVAVMSYRAWEQQYGADPTIVGSTFIIDGAPLTIAGIAPPSFFGDTLRPDPPDFWLPLSAEPIVHKQNALLDRKGDYWVYAIGRLNPGVSAAAVESKVNALARQWQEVNDPPPGPNIREQFDRQHIAVVPAGGGISSLQQSFAADLKLLTTITGMVLLIACANLANLMLARGIANRAQSAIRVALGAPRARLIRATLTESILVAIAGGALGLLFAMAGTDALLKLAFHRAAFIPIDAAPSPAVLAFTFLLALATGIVFGTLPAWTASRTDPAEALRGAGRSAAAHTGFAQKALVAVQVALSVVLLAGAGLLVQTLGNLQNQKFGFRAEGRVVVNVNTALAGYAPAKLAAVYGEIERAMGGLAGVRNVALSLYSPMEGNNWSRGISVEGHPADPSHPSFPSWDRVSSHFFETIGTPILRGRMFDERDTPAARHVAVVNQAFAERYFPNEDPLGRRFGMGGWQHRADYEIVGVVDNVRFRNPRLPSPPMYFLPLLQMSEEEWKDNSMARSNLIGNIELEILGAPRDLGAQVRHTLAAIDPNLTVLNVTTISEQLGDLLGHERLVARLTELFGVLAMLLAAVGLYGVTTHAVARRTGEIGIRMALGATPGSVMAMVMRGVLAQLGWGIAIGIPAALGAGRILSGQLFGVHAADPLTLVLVVAALCGAALIAALSPALRAARTDVLRAL